MPSIDPGRSYAADVMRPRRRGRSGGPDEGLRRGIPPYGPIQVAAATLLAAALIGVVVTPALAVPPAPKPTSTASSPGAPDPHPGRGGISLDGEAVGGVRLLARGLVVPSGAPALPVGLTARAWVLSDLDTGEILAARDAHGRYQPASILKALTSLVLLPELPGNRTITASPAAANAEGSAVGLVAGGRYTVDTLFRALLLMSGNDAATALAEAGGGVARTVAAMNAEAQRLGAYDTFVQTPSGLDGWQQLTSAYDLSLVLRAVADNARFLAYDRTMTSRLPPERVGTKTWGPVPLANQSADFFTTVPGALLAKTGFTDAAQHTFLGAAEQNGRRLGVVFLRAQRAPTDQWQQAATLLKWGFALPVGVTPVGTLAAPVGATSTTGAVSTAGTISPATRSSVGPVHVLANGTARPAAARSGTDDGGLPVRLLLNVGLLVLLAGALIWRGRQLVGSVRAGRR